MIRRLRSLNRNEATWLLILSGYAAFLFYLVACGKITDLVHPRMVPFVVFGLAIRVLLAVFQSRRVFSRGTESAVKPGMALFVVPFAFAPLSLGSTSAVLAANSRTISLYSSPEPVSVTANISAQSPRPQAAEASPIPARGVIELNEKTYFPFYSELNNHPNKYAGRTIHVTGFVYHGNLRNTDKFIAGREMMWCCAADAVTIGFVSRFPGAAGLKDDQWVSVTGVLDKTEYTDEYTQATTVVPMIRVTSMRAMPKMDFAYVYPTF